MVGLVPTIQPSACSVACREVDSRDKPEDDSRVFSIAKKTKARMLPRLCCIQEIGRISKADRCFLAIKPRACPTSEHAQDDCRKEGEGDDGGKHVEPHPQFHLGFLCRYEPALRCRFCGPNLPSLREASRGRQEKSCAAVH